MRVVPVALREREKAWPGMFVNVEITSSLSYSTWLFDTKDIKLKHRSKINHIKIFILASQGATLTSRRENYQLWFNLFYSYNF